MTQTPITRTTLAQVYGISETDMVDAPFEAGTQAFQDHLSRITHSRQALRQAFGWHPETCIFLFVGTLLRFKGVFTILDAVQMLQQKNLSYDPPAFQVLLIGSKASQPGEWDLDAYRRQVVTQGLEKWVFFPGPRSREALAETCLAADACLLPTQKDCWPKVLVEAALAGLPLVTTNACGAAGALVQDGKTGFVIPPANPHALAHAMEKLLDPTVRQTLGNQARHQCQTYSDPEQETLGFLQAIHRAS